MRKNDSIIIAETEHWITNIVVGCNFCPFAARELKHKSIHYEVLQKADNKTALGAILQMFIQLDKNKDVETSFLILVNNFVKFAEYWQFVKQAEKLLVKNNYEGIYQIASFHPAYLFAGSSEVDPANYTNRSPYPMLHFLREASVSKALKNYPLANDISQKNIDFANDKGLHYMKKLAGF